jgi:HD superfamily phosphohydrolase/serine/threonine protein kinase
MTHEAEKKLDLVTVLSVVWAAARRDPEWVARNISSDGKRVKTNAVLDLVVDICGHDLKLAADRPFVVGGGGVIIPSREVDAPEVRYALKVARPSLFVTGDEPKSQLAEAEVGKAKAEYLTHLPLAHENIAKMLAFDELEMPVNRVLRVTLPCTLIEWVDDALPIDKYIASNVHDPYQLADLIAQTCRALAHLHYSQRIHWDVKGDNALVRGDGVVKLMDLGNARPIRSETATYDEDERAQTTDRNLPPKLQARHRNHMKGLGGDDAQALESISLNRIPCSLITGERVWDRPWLDLYMLARELNRVLGFDADVLRADANPPNWTAIETLRPRIFRGEDGEYVFAYLKQLFGRILAAFEPEIDPFYESADEVVAALERLRPEYGEATDIPELQPVPQHVLRVPPTENVPWTPRVGALMNSRPLLRLKKHRQLATVHHVFPGAEHTRWEHIAGTLDKTLQYVRALYADRSSVVFRLDTSKLDVTALMLATLVHDLGHPAFGHQLEESPVIPLELKHEHYALEVLHACRASSRGSTPHEVDAQAIREAVEKSWCGESISSDALIGRTIDILEAPARTPHTGQEESEVIRERRVHLELLNSIVMGQLDADKADYLIRDAHHCGVEYPNGIDRQRLDQSLTSLRHKVDGVTEGMIGVTEKGVLPLESLLIARYQMFRAVYWQKTVRAMTVMLQEAVENFVAPGAPPSNVNNARLAELIQVFRANTDVDALSWLETKFKAKRQKEVCRGAAGDREHIFRRVTEFFGGESFDSTGNIAFVTYDDEIYRTLVELWSSGVAGGNALAALSARRAFRQRLATGINNRLKATSGISIRLGYEDILLDVPLAGKDEVTGLFVARDVGGDRVVVPLDRMTPLAQAVAAAFDRSVRPARVFVRPAVATRFFPSRDSFARFARIVHDEVRHVILGEELPLELLARLPVRA